jgi:hypothetical protein
MKEIEMLTRVANPYQDMSKTLKKIYQLFEFKSVIYRFSITF